MADITLVGVRLVVEGQQAATAELGAFDAKAKATVESLKDMGGPGVTQGMQRLVVSLETASGSMDRASTATDNLHSKLKGIDNTLSGMSSSLMHFSLIAGGVGAASLVGLGAAAVGFGLSAASSFEQSRISFETMLGSVSKGDALFRSLQQFNFKTPFGLPDITAATQTLLQYGFNGSNVMPVLKTLTNVASAAPAGQGADDLQRQALALGQISAAGVVRGQDINQLTQAGFPIIRLLQQVTGMSGPALQAQLRGGGLALPASQLVDAIAGGGGSVLQPYAHAAELQSHSLSGVFSNFKDSLRMSVASASQPLVSSLEKDLTPIGDSLAHALDTVMPQLTQFVTTLADHAPAAIAKIGPLLKGLLDGLQQNGPMLLTFFRDMGALIPDLARVGGSLLPVLDGLFRGLHDLLSLPYGIGTGLVAGLLTALLGYNALSGTIGVIRSMATAIDLLATAQGRQRMSQSLGSVGAGGKVLGGVGGALGVGFAGYNAYQNGPSLTNVAGGAVSGAVLGATLGSVVPGVGTGIGAGIGALLGGSASLAGGLMHHETHLHAGAIVVNNPQSDAQIAAAVQQGIRDHEESTARRGA